ncbi:hypothetical protein [uncultured Acinetobacter sp.]|uniref:hypothetical protein n=1 Tax=uncultured Acinetobacter sp. TaxID=165433 RepID=UPI002585098D|nr:hypothetical protein [uncultured Acinetobacter sp.]
MSLSYHLLMPISKQALRDIDKTKKLIERLVELNLISLDLPVEVWNYPFMEDEQEYDEIELHYDSLGEFYDDLDNLRLDEINFDLGFSRYDSDYHQYQEQGKLPIINAITNELMEYLIEFCDQHKIEPIPDIFGQLQVGFISSEGEDDQGEICGIGLYCDGNMTYFVEEAGFLDTLKNSNLRFYQVLEEIAIIYGEELTLQFRG